jgi:L-2,4-diaminobutyrate decarboxylase
MTSSDLLGDIFNSEHFRTSGHALVEILADHLQKISDRNSGLPVTKYVDPESEYQFWKDLDERNPEVLLKTILDRSINIHHPGFMGHQVSAPAPLAALAAFEGALLNNGGAVFEMGQASCALERYIIDEFKPSFGFGNEADGFFTSGGTIANLTALLSARAVAAGHDIWSEGNDRQYAFMVSEEAHYCIDRAVRIMGWGSKGIISIPVDDGFRMRTDLLEEKYRHALNEGVHVLGVVGSAPSTATGIYDNLEAIGRFCVEHKLWFHIDAAHGGPAVFSEKYKHLMEGSSFADSVTVDAHKMMMVPGLTTMLFFKNFRTSYQTFAQRAHYLWNSDDAEWYNYGKRTMECTKLMMSIRVYLMLKTYGKEAFGAFIDHCYDLGRHFYQLLTQHTAIETAVQPDSNIVCFRYKNNSITDHDHVNSRIRERILNEGDFYIVQTKIKGQLFLRTTLISPLTQSVDLQALISKVLGYGDEIIFKEG